MLLQYAIAFVADFCMLHLEMQLSCVVHYLFAAVMLFGSASCVFAVLRSTSAYDLTALRAVVRYLQSGLLRLARPRGFSLLAT